MNNLVEKYIEKAEDFREYLNQAGTYNEDITLSQAEWMLKKAAQEKQKNLIWDYIFKDDLKVRIPVNFEVPFTKIYYNDAEVAHGEINVVKVYNELCHNLFSTLQSIVGKGIEEMTDNIYDIPNSYDEFEEFPQDDIHYASDILREFLYNINKPLLQYHLLELDSVYRQGEDMVEFSYHSFRTINGSHYYPALYTRDELKTMLLLLLRNPKVTFNSDEPLTDREKENYVFHRYRRLQKNQYEGIYNLFRENTSFCKRISKLPKKVKPARCVRKLLDKLKVDKEVYDDFEAIQDYYSLLKQYTYVEGILVLSLDPMDFISASDTTYNWQSCFSVMNQRGYSRGCYTALTAPDICIAYVEGSKPYRFGKDKECSNKKWRAWVSINEDFFFVNKGYPFKSEPLTNFIESKIFSLTPQVWLDARKFKIEPVTTFEAMYSDFSDKTTVYFNSESIEKFPIISKTGEEVTRELGIRLGGKTFDPFTEEAYDYTYEECNGTMWGAPETYNMGMCEWCEEYFDLTELREDSYGNLYCENCGNALEEEEECEDDE